MKAKILKYVEKENWEGLVFEDAKGRLKVTDGDHLWDLTEEREAKIRELKPKGMDAYTIKFQFVDNYPYTSLVSQL